MRSPPPRTRSGTRSPGAATGSSSPTTTRPTGTSRGSARSSARIVTGVLTGVVELITILVALRMLAVLALAAIDRRRALRRRTDRSFAPPVSILVPAHDEAVGIARGVQSLAASRYPGPFEVIVVDDG